MRRKIKKLIETTVNPAVASHGGKIHLVDFLNDTVYVRMSGGCQGCAASQATLRNGIRRLVVEEYPQVQDVIDVTDHSLGDNPYYS